MVFFNSPSLLMNSTAVPLNSSTDSGHGIFQQPESVDEFNGTAVEFRGNSTWNERVRLPVVDPYSMVGNTNSFWGGYLCCAERITRPPARAGSWGTLSQLVR